jgi:class 3 adenylate cyclase/HPt (histidine-containing phosphotransfer) domain-containing protein
VTDLAAPDVIAAARGALASHAWSEAYELLDEADRSGPLPGVGLQMLAESAWWCGEPEVVLEAGERAFAAYVEEGDPSAAALAALELAQQHAMRLAGAVAGGWLAQAERLLADLPDAPAHAHLAWMRGIMALEGDHDAERAVAHFEEAGELAARVADRNLMVTSLHDKGRALCALGRFAEGSSLMDEAMAATIAGELEPMSAGIVYCSMIGVCSHVEDYKRAAEWTEATTRWCDRQSIAAFPGVCRVHRAEILRVRGAWTRAEEEARRACDELPRYNLLEGVGAAYYEIAEVRRRRGDLAGAEEAYGRAHEFGRDPQPGLALLRLAQGKVGAAATAVRRTLADDTIDRVSRVRPLAAQVEIALAADDPATAAAAADELGSIADAVGTRALRARADTAQGAVRLATGDLAAAVPALRRALQGWREVDAPYEAAETRVLIGRTYAALDDPDGAVFELRAARDGFERLGAVSAVERAGSVLGEVTGTVKAPERVRRAFMFTDIVRSTELVSAIGDPAWEDLLTWHDQALRSAFASHGGEVAHPTGDGFLVTFGDSDAALACAIRVQRTLAEHRRQHGFAPLVRIGVHVDEATRRGQDYSGAGVHAAARIAALAEGGQILVSAATLEEASGGEATGGAREVALREVVLRGFSEPVQLAEVEWR